MVEVLVVYYSREGSTAELARQACRGIESIDGASATLRTVPAVSASSEAAPQAVPRLRRPERKHRRRGIALGERRTVSVVRHLTEKSV